MSLLSPLTKPADNENDESETDGHLTRMGPRLIMNVCLIFPGPLFSQCKVANSELLLHSHTCAQLSYGFETSSHRALHCGGKQCSIFGTRVVTAIQTYAPGLIHVVGHYKELSTQRPGSPKNTTQHHDVSVQSTLDRRPMYYSQKMDPSSPNANAIMWTHTSLEINIKFKIK